MLLPVSPQPVESFSTEFGSLECNVEIVDSLQDAVQVSYVIPTRLVMLYLPG